MATALGIIIATASVWSATAAGADAPSREPVTGAGLGAFPAGIACPFAVSFDLVSGADGQLFTFFDHNGDVVRLMNTTMPGTWIITNLDTGASITLTGQGGVARITPSADGTTTVVLSGGIIGFNTPADTPPGPFALWIDGRLNVLIKSDGTVTLSQLAGKTVDLCAAVS
jgi:hypothetical protein